MLQSARLPLDELTPDPDNARIHGAKNLEAIVGSLRQFGQIEPLVVQASSKRIIGGNGRFEAMRRLEWEKADVVLVDLDDVHARALGLALNRTSELAAWDEGRLGRLIMELDADAFCLEGIGFDADDVAHFSLPERSEGGGSGEAGETENDDENDGPVELEEDEAPEEAEARVKPGELWLLGEHRLLCADAGEPATLARLFAGGEKAALMATDPPYGVAYKSTRYVGEARAKNWDAIQNDERQGADLRAWLAGLLRLWLGQCSEQASFYCWSAALEPGYEVLRAMREAGIHVQGQVVWVKNFLVLGQADYQWRHEICWYGFLKGKQHTWLGGRDKTTVWEIKRVTPSEYVHPMQKPVNLYGIPMQHHTSQGDLVAEPFAGSGSCLIAAEQLGRRCYATEIEPKFCDVILARWERLTGRRACREEDPANL